MVLPVFFDIDPVTLVFLVSAEKCISNKSKALVVVHLYGRSADLVNQKLVMHIMLSGRGLCPIAFGAMRYCAVGSVSKFAAWSFILRKSWCNRDAELLRLMITLYLRKLVNCAIMDKLIDITMILRE